MRTLTPKTLELNGNVAVRGLILLVVCLGTGLVSAGEPVRPPAAEEARGALRKAAGFFQNQVASRGGYVWRYSSDLKHRQGEAAVGASTIWVQPPGTPAVGEAFLDAYEVTGEPQYLQAARETAEALLRGQLQSGGWNYRIEFDAEQRKQFAYRQDGEPRRTTARWVYPGGWEVWRRRTQKGNITIIDDDTTPSALRLLMRVDGRLQFEDAKLHEAAGYALDSLLNAQYPIGAWSHNYDQFPSQPPAADHYPVTKASCPESWSRTWTRDFSGCYSINDRNTLNMIATMLVAYRVYGDERYLASAEQGGEFLILAQMPDPQPAWAQQYDRQMQPVWDRPFEPPAISGLESQDVLETLLLLYRKTGRRKYLNPIPPALDYLRSSRLADGRLARFYELETNRPLYFTRDYQLTYRADESPTHYGFVFDSRLDAIESDYRRLLAVDPSARDAENPPVLTGELAAQVRSVIDSLDTRGAWTEPGWVRDEQGRKVEPEDGIIQASTFIANVKTLAQFIVASRPAGP